MRSEAAHTFVEPRRLLASGLIAAVLCIGSTSVAHAAVPANDDFADAEQIPAALPVTVPGNNADATPEPDEPSHGEDPALTSVWFSWTPIVSGHAKVSLCNSTSGKPFAVYTGNSLTTLDRVVDTRSGGCSRNIAIQSGTEYRIAVDSHGGTFGAFNLSLRAATPPANDNFDAAHVIGTMPVTLNSSNLDATAETGEPLHQGAGPRKSVWFKWTAPSHGPAFPTVHACAGDFTPTVAVYVGNAVSALTPVDPEGGTYYCHFNFETVPGTTYWIAVDGFLGFPNPDEGQFTLTIQGPVAPPNDNFGAAQVLGSSLPVSSSGSTVLATDEPGEPDHVGLEPFYSVWYSWTSPSTGPVTVDTCFVTFDSVLAVYTGASLGALTSVAASDDGLDYCFNLGGSDYGSAAPFNAVAGTTYRFAVDAWDDTGPGSFVLTVRATGPHTTPGTQPPHPGVTGTTCPKGKKLVKGKCVKKKKKKKKKRKR